MKKIFSIILFLVMGLFLFGFGVAMLIEDDVSCGGKVMSEGDECVQYKDGVEVGTNSLAEQRASDQRYGYGGLVVGVAFLATGGWQIYRTFANKAKTPVA